MTADGNDNTIVQTIIAMAHNLNLDVIAEGVETEEQRQLLLNEGCTQFQGYLFSKPVPIDQFESLMKLHTCEINHRPKWCMRVSDIKRQCFQPFKRLTGRCKIYRLVTALTNGLCRCNPATIRLPAPLNGRPITPEYLPPQN